MKLQNCQATCRTSPFQDGDEVVGANFSFGFHTYLLSCIIFPFALRYFVNYAPWLRAVCKFGYSLLSRAFASFFTCFYQFNSVLAVDLFPVSLTTNPCCPQHLVSSFVFIMIPLISFCSRFKVVFFLYCNYYFRSLQEFTFMVR